MFCRYKTIVDGQKQTGRGRSTWKFTEEMAEVMAKDPAIAPGQVLTTLNDDGMYACMYVCMAGLGGLRVLSLEPL